MMPNLPRLLHWSLICSLTLGSLCCFSLRAEDQAADQKPADSEKVEWKPLFDGKSLEGWKISEFGTQGEILAEDGQIILGMGDGCSGVTLTGDFPKINYEVRLEAQRVDGTDFFCGMTFPVGKDPCSLIVGGWAGAVVGLSSIDGKDAVRNETRRYMTFKKGQWYKIRVRVTADRIVVWIDDEVVVNQVTTGRKLTIRPEVNASKPFGICSWCTTAALRKIEVRELTDADLKAPPPPPLKPQEPSK